MFNDALFNTGVFNAEPDGGAGEKITLLIGQQSSRPSRKVYLKIGQGSLPHGVVSLAIGQRSVAASKRASLLIGQGSLPHGVVSLLIGQASHPVDVGRGQIVGWRLSANINGVDVSSRLTGAWRVDAERGLSRIAEFRLVTTSQEVDTMEYYRRPVRLLFHYQLATGQVISHSLFSGRILEPDYDVDSRQLIFRCSDMLQEQLDAMTQAQLDEHVGGYFSEAVYDATMTGWGRAQIMALSQASSYDLDRHGRGVLSAWDAGETLHAYQAGEYVAGSLRFEQANAGDIHNISTITFDYRYTRKRFRDYTYSWQMQPSVGCEFLNNPFQLPQRSMIQSACESTGWELLQLSFVDLPKPQAFECHINGRTYQMPWGYEVINNSLVPDQDQALLCQGFWAKFRRRWAQTVTEQYQITLRAGASVGLLGKIEREVTSGVETEFDGEAWESQTGATDRHLGSARVSITGDLIRDVDDETDVDRTEMEHAMATLQAVSVGEMLRAHRQNYLSWDVMCDPLIERHDRASIAADNLQSEGHVYQLVHSGDIESGDARTTITVDLSRIGATASEGAGVVPAIQPIASPDSDIGAADPDAGFQIAAGVQYTHIGGSVTSRPFNDSWVGYMTNYGFDEFDDQPFNPDAPEAEMYPVQFVVPAPAIESELRQAVTVDAEPATVNVVIPVDRLIYS